MQQQKKTIRRWTPEENHMLLESVQSFSTLNACFMAVARETGRSPKAVEGHYYKIVPSASDSGETTSSASKKWTPEEDNCLLRYVENSPLNLHACFLAVAEQLGRTPHGVSAHWYSVLSKKPEVRAFFFASKHYISMNRKNSSGVESDSSIWRKLLRVIKIIGL